LATQLGKILEKAIDDEKDYLQEAIGCAVHGFYRASIILAWNAAIHRMHKVLEQRGFDEFNKTCAELKNIKDGIYKRFDKNYVVRSINDLRQQLLIVTYY
jgi:hypothetical protein